MAQCSSSPALTASEAPEPAFHSSSHTQLLPPLQSRHCSPTPFGTFLERQTRSREVGRHCMFAHVTHIDIQSIRLDTDTCEQKIAIGRGDMLHGARGAVYIFSLFSHTT